MIKDSNGLVHCYPGAVLGICTLSPAFKRFTLDSKAEREEQFFKKHKWAFVRDLPSPSPKFQNNKTYLLLDLEESSTYTNWSHQSPKGYTVRNKKKSRLPQSITWSILFYWWSSFSKPKLREKKNCIHSFHLANQLALKWAWGMSTKMLHAYKWTKIQKYASCT